MKIHKPQPTNNHNKRKKLFFTPQPKLKNKEENKAIQAKLKVGSSNDKTEKEAGQTADNVVDYTKYTTIGPSCMISSKPPSNELIQRAVYQMSRGYNASKKTAPSTATPIQRKASDLGSSSPDHSNSKGSKNETGLPTELRSGLENLSGEDLSGVRVHRNSDKPEALNAHAYAQGQDIHLAPGQEKHLPHEGWHVVQQMQGRVAPTIQKKDAAINDDAGLEKEADVMGAKAVNRGIKNSLKKNNVATSNNKTNSTIQLKLPKETPTDYKTYAELSVMTIYELHRYANKQADWHASPHLLDSEREIIRTVLGFVREPNILQGASGMLVGVLHQEMVFTGIAIAKQYLEIYSKAVGTQDPFYLNKTNAPAKAIKTGKNLQLLKIAFPSYVLKSAMKEDNFNTLQRNNFILDLINYYSTPIPNPLFAALDGDDFKSYNLMKTKDGVDPLTFYKLPLKGNIRSFHRFEKAALDQLILNFNDTSKTKPLTLILHSSLDHNGIFHRDGTLTSVIKEPSVNTILIEGKETLADIQTEIEPIAKKYGVNDKIDQVMFAGHGNARSMQLAGSVQDVGKGELQEVKDSLDLDNNKVDTNKLMKEVLANMDGKGIDQKDWQPHRRVVFNACLTNSNAVRTALLGSDIPTLKLEIKRFIRANASLATHLQNLADKKKNPISSVGSNASFGQIDLIDPATKDLDLIDKKGDPELTSSKLRYVEFGTDPSGAMRAVVECWADNTPTCKTAMQNRIAASIDKSWEEVLIKECYEIVLTKYWSIPQGIIMMEQVAGILDHIAGKESCHPSNFNGLDTLGSDFVDLMVALKTSLHWGALPYIPLVMYQGWMTAAPTDANVQRDFLTHLSTNFTCSTAKKFVDIGYLDKNGHLPNLLSTTGDGQMILALLGMLDAKKPAVCKQYLISELNTKDKFDAVKGVEAKLNGLGTEDQILIAIGKMVAPSITKVTKTNTANKDANVLIYGDTNNKEFINSVTYKGEIKTAPEAETFTKPDPASGKLTPLKMSQTIYILGDINTWWAIEYMHGTKIGTAFVKKSDVKII